MTELQKSYPIEKELNLADTSSLSTTHTEKAGNETIEGDNESTIPVVVSYPPRINSKLILQNMEEVLHTVKKQHKEKHRRKKELKKLAMINSAATGESASLSGVDRVDGEEKPSHTDRKTKHRDKEKRHGKKRPLQEKSTVENGKVPQESPHKTGTILQHFPRTPKKDSAESTEADSRNTSADAKNGINENNKKVKTPVKNHKVTNAFEVMMNARNKTIGSNTPGKDSPSPVNDKEGREALEKRKLKLQEWAEQKGGAKRKLEVEAREQYVEEQLEQRAKRFKKMLVKGASPKSTENKQKLKFKENAGKGRDNDSDKGKEKEKEKKVEKKRRYKRRAQRFSSLESNDSIEVVSSSIDVETDEFLAKLNSPTKKRDSLLGYFSKKESPKDVAKQALEIKKGKGTPTINVSSIPVRKGKKGAISAIASDSTPAPVVQATSNEFGTPSGRPKRSCVGKPHYKYIDLGDSPVTVKPTQAKETPARKRQIRSVGTPNLKTETLNDLVIVLDDSTTIDADSATVTPQGTPKTLAPLFVRSVPKSCPDPEILKAKRAFLQSGVPEKLRIEQEKQKQFQQTYEESNEIFPQIAHIRQLNEEDKLIDEKCVSCSFKLEPEEAFSENCSSTFRRGKGRQSKRTINIGFLSECTQNDFKVQHRLISTHTLEQAILPSLTNKREVVKNWKIEFERFPTFKCYNQMREKYRYFNAIDSAQDTEQVTESFVVTRRTRRSMELNLKNNDTPDEEYKPPAMAPNGELLFSEKYKPLMFEQVLVNLNPVMQLKEFLSSWSTNGRGSGSAKNSQDFDDSMDFNDSTSQGPSCNTVVLLGPVSSGKTNAVFALANEMNFNVLEINAGMKRTGKKLIQELHEATQSHQIRKDAAGPGSSQKSNLLKMSLSGLKSKMKRQNSNSNNIDTFGTDSSNGDTAQTDRKSLILIDDADIVFEQTDAGFTDAIYTLAASSKRPVIVIATNPNCAHLQRLMTQNTILFPPQNVLNISRFLQVLSLIENCPVLLDDIVSLYLYNNRDLRKTLLELQFFIQSGGDRKIELTTIKENNETPKESSSSFFASPRKRQFSIEQNLIENQDNNLPMSGKGATARTNELVYLHRFLFDFYTCCQNSKHRIPFPPDFQTFGANLSDIFKVSRKLMADNNFNTTEKNAKANTKRKSKSPKKQWLSNATRKIVTPLDNLCQFYENVSVASLMDRESIVNCRISLAANKTPAMDRINNNISENISHTLLETAITVNLDAEARPYNLFDTPKEIVSLCNELGAAMQMRSKRSRCLDYEPCLRSICRSEKTRTTLERRSTRFYHYLRTYALNVCNFSTAQFDQACGVFQSFETEKQETSELKGDV